MPPEHACSRRRRCGSSSSSLLPRALARRCRSLLRSSSNSAHSPPSTAAWEQQEEEALDLWQAELTDETREAIASSLDKLEWRELLQQVGRFCATALGRERILAGKLGTSRKESQRLLAETAAALSLETQYCLTLDFGGANTAVVRAFSPR